MSYRLDKPFTFRFINAGEVCLELTNSSIRRLSRLCSHCVSEG